LWEKNVREFLVLEEDYQLLTDLIMMLATVAQIGQRNHLGYPLPLVRVTMEPMPPVTLN
jgi:hypothetical protein